jgi:hypothetical protein
MLKRVAAALLWYAMAWVGYEIASSIVGVPRPVGPILAAAMAMIVVVDPFRLFWPHADVGAAKPFRIGSSALDRTAASTH